MIRTVLGEIEPAALGHCQMHEHVLVLPTPASAKNPALCFCDAQKSEEELMSYHAAGGRALLDAQPYGAGRCAEALPALSRASGVHIVASTGFHLLDYYQSEASPTGINERALAELFIGECAVGARHSVTDETLPFKTGAIKAALPKEGVCGQYKGLLKAAGIAARETGALLFIHTEAGAGALDAIAFLGEYIPAERVMICHADRRLDDPGLHEAIAKAGALLDYDTIGRFKYHDDMSEVRHIAWMIERGFQKQIVLSLDPTAARLKAYGGEIGMAYLLESFLPLLRANVPEDAITDMTINNAARALSGCAE